MKRQVHPCVCFMLIQDGKILLEQRAADKALDPGLLTIPGGHIEPGESQQQALARELMEELNLSACEPQFLCSLYHPTTTLQLLHFYVITQWQGEMKVLEAQAVHWHAIDSAPVAIEADRIALAEYARVYRHLRSSE
ncbi:MAG: NUDIX domain-containing protein [Pseudomonadales bacterium]